MKKNGDEGRGKKTWSVDSASYRDLLGFNGSIEDLPL